MSATDSFSTTRSVSSGRRPAEVPVRRLGERVAIVRGPRELDEQAARALGRSILAATDDGARELVLDLTAVRAHAWPAVYALCELEAHLTEACCESVAATPNPMLVQDLRAVGLDHAWALAPSVDDALADLLVRPVS
jgi:anti-anti-sigma regulatory factor